MMPRSGLAIALLFLCACALAQPYPQRTARIIVPFTTGGGTDFIARLLGSKLSATRVSALPELPTVHESGYRFEVSNWHGLMGPRGLPPAIVDKLNSDVNRIVNDPEFAQRIASDGLIPAGGPPERLLKLLNEKIANWAKVAERAGLKVQ